MINGGSPFNQPPLDGVLAIDKPRGMTSHDVVARVRRLAGLRRVGHTGTLDPMATGLLLVCLGPATRIAQFLTGMDKVYSGVITFGAISATYDAEGDITRQDRPLPELDGLREAMREMLGERTQLPPPFSAVKVAGKKLYEYARAGEPAPAKPRLVRIHRFELRDYQPPMAAFTARVGSGTYIRSMAHDLGLRLGCGGYLSALRRTQVGPFAVENASPLAELEADPELIPARLLSLSEALGHFPKITLQAEAERVVRHGGLFRTADIFEFEGTLRAGEPVLVLNESGQALSIAQGAPERGPVEELTLNYSAEAGDDPENWLRGPALVFRPLRVLA